MFFPIFALQTDVLQFCTANQGLQGIGGWLVA